MPRTTTLLLLSSVLLAARIAEGQSERIQSTAWKARHHFRNRYEGFADVPTARDAFEVRDFFALTDVKIPSTPTQLHLLYYIPDGQPVQSVSVAQRKHETTYMMIPIREHDRPGSWNSFSSWPTSDFIVPNGILIDSLAPLVVLSQLNDIYAPAILYGNQRPARIDSYVFDVYLDKSFRRLSCYITDSDGHRVVDSLGEVGCSHDQRRRRIDAGTVVRLSIPAAKLPKGRLSVHLDGEYANSEVSKGLSRELGFYNEPELPW